MSKASAGQAAQCVRCISHQFARNFSSARPTRAPQAPYVPPESPSYIEVPRSPQQYHAPVRGKVRGVLPVPRDVVNPKRAPRPHRRLTTLEDAIQAPTSRANVVESPRHALNQQEAVIDRRHVAEQRRQNLKQGFHELKDRQVREAERESAETEKRARHVEEARSAGPLDDEVFTASSVSPLLTPYTGPTPDPDRFTRLAVKAQNQALHATKAVAERRAHLHTLYTHARRFITTEEQLNQELERVFVPSPQWWVATNNPDRVRLTTGDNVWSRGPQLRVSQMLADRESERKGDTFGLTEGRKVTPERMKILRELMTGGREPDRSPKTGMSGTDVQRIDEADGS